VPYPVEDAEYLAGAGAEGPSSGERAVRLEREAGYEQVVGDGQVEHEAHGGRALDGARQRHNGQRVADGADNERHQIEDEYGVTQFRRVHLTTQTTPSLVGHSVAYAYS